MSMWAFIRYRLKFTKKEDIVPDLPIRLAGLGPQNLGLWSAPDKVLNTGCP